MVSQFAIFQNEVWQFIYVHGKYKWHGSGKNTHD